MYHLTMTDWYSLVNEVVKKSKMAAAVIEFRSVTAFPSRLPYSEYNKRHTIPGNVVARLHMRIYYIRIHIFIFLIVAAFDALCK